MNRFNGISIQTTKVGDAIKRAFLNASKTLEDVCLICRLFQSQKGNRDWWKKQGIRAGVGIIQIVRDVL